MQTLAIPIDEYQNLVQQVNLLKQQELLQQMNKLIDLMYQSKYGFYLGDNTDDLAEYSMNDIGHLAGDCWDEL